MFAEESMQNGREAIEEPPKTWIHVLSTRWTENGWK